MVDTVIQNLINGALMGCIYALITLGLSIIYGVMNVVNFAHGDFVMLSMYFTFWVGALLGFDAVATPVLTFPLLFLFGILAYYALIDRTLRHMYVTQIAVTVGLMTLLRAVAQMAWKAQPRALPYSIIQGNIRIAGVTIMLSRLITAGVSILAIVGVYLFLTKTWPGRAIRAASDDLDAASLTGVNYKRTYALAFGLGSALTALAGLGSIPGLLITGVIVGGTEALTMSLWDPRARSLIVYLIFVLVLWLKPRGLFGRK